MYGSERRTFILKQLEESGSVRVAELAAALQVDLVTIRRDLAQLETEGRLERVHGGAIRKAVLEPPAQPTEQYIAEAAARFIPENSAVFLGPGTLTLALVPWLKERSHLTIITNALDIAWQVAHQRQHTLHLIGGQVQVEEDYSLYGDLAALEQIRADWVVLEAGGVDAERGVTHDHQRFAQMARQLFRLGAEILVLVLPERVGRAAAVFVAPAEEIDTLVTGRGAPSAPLWDLSELGMKVVLT